jgi:cytochrome c peroxidase
MSETKARLGRYVFYDKRISVNGTQSCASCHRQELAFTNGNAMPLGATGQRHPRKAMSLVNVAYGAVLTWSNPNLRSLEQQALIPMFSEHPIELGLQGREGSLVGLLRSDLVYKELFPKAFGNSKDPLTVANLTKALAAFERTIISARSPYDRYHLEGDQVAISYSAQRGEALFFNDQFGGCFRCHGGFNFSDATDYVGSPHAAVRFHNTGLYNIPGKFSYPMPNLGIFEHTKNPGDIGKFKAPSLRNVGLTAPYMHDGSIATLGEVLDHYAAGGRTIAEGPYAGRGHDNQNKDTRITGIGLTLQNRADLLAFLQSLTDADLLHDARFGNPW